MREQFDPFVRRKSILSRDREVLRTELANLGKILPYPPYVRLLKRLVRLYRRSYYHSPKETLRFMRDSLPALVKASENWISIFRAQGTRPAPRRVHDQVNQLLDAIDGVLEGCLQPQLRLAHGFAAHDQTGSFPPDILKKDFGLLLQHLRAAIGPSADLLTADPLYGIAASQWRNIAAHRSFRILDERTVEVEWGRRTLHRKTILLSDLNGVVEWSTRSLAASRLAGVIVYLELMPELGALGLPDVSMRIESWMITLSHNLGLVGFQVTDWGDEQDIFYLSLRARSDRTSTEALIHASQALDQLAVAVETDPTYRNRTTRVEVRLMDATGLLLGSATIAVRDAVSATRGELSMAERIDRTYFDFSDREAARRELGKSASEQ